MIFDKKSTSYSATKEESKPRKRYSLALRRQRPQVRILSGAPLLNKRENFWHGFGDALGRASGQNRFRAADADFLVGDPDFVHEQLDRIPPVGLGPVWLRPRRAARSDSGGVGGERLPEPGAGELQAPAAAPDGPQSSAQPQGDGRDSDTACGAGRQARFALRRAAQAVAR